MFLVLYKYNQQILKNLFKNVPVQFSFMFDLDFGTTYSLQNLKRIYSGRLRQRGRWPLLKSGART